MDEVKLNDSVQLEISGENGRVVGIANYVEQGTHYQVHYVDSNGCAKTEWFTRSQILLNAN